MAAWILTLIATAPGLGRLSTWLPVREPYYIDPPRLNEPEIYPNFALRNVEFGSPFGLQLQISSDKCRTLLWDSAQLSTMAPLHQLWPNGPGNPKLSCNSARTVRTEQMDCFLSQIVKWISDFPGCHELQESRDPVLNEESSPLDIMKGQMRDQPIGDYHGVPLKWPEQGALCW